MNDKQLQELQRKIRFYQFDPLGAETWMEDHICVAVTDYRTGQQQWVPLGEVQDIPHPDTGRSYKSMWDYQKENVIRPATSRDENGFLTYSTVVNCTPRGEGKSYLNVLLILWRFFTQPRQLIILGANSKDQSKFALYDIITELILNSPKLVHILGAENIKEKEIRMRDSHSHVASKIMAVSAFTGIYSNITAFAFSEIFDMTNPKFYYQLDSSRRNIPNAQGYIDSTVSEVGHVLHNLYEASSLRKNTDPGILFHYRFSDDGHYKDYLHPGMTHKQLQSFKAKFTTSEFAKYFKNTWESNDTAVYNRPLIRSMRYIGMDGHLGQQPAIMKTMKQIDKLEREQDKAAGFVDNRSVIDAAQSGLWPIPYSLEDNFQPTSADISDLQNLSEIYDTEWGLGVGLDLADPLKDDTTKGARTILSLIAKGLPGSRSDPDLHLKIKESGKSPKYLYFLLHLQHIESNEIADIKFSLDLLLGNFGHLNTLCCERWGAADLRFFCDENLVQLELISPTYERQRAGFNPMYTAIKTGYFKSPKTVIAGSKLEDILEEEMIAFRHDVTKKWYGSLTKKQSAGVQDDTMFSICWGFYGVRELTPEDFEAHSGNIFMGAVMNDTSNLVGNY